MPRSAKKKSPNSKLKGFFFAQPFIGFTSSIRSIPKQGEGGKSRNRRIDCGSTCREEIIWDTREQLVNEIVSYKRTRNSWKQELDVNRRLDIDHQSLKQPGTTHLWINLQESDMYELGGYACTRACCLGRLPEILDALVGTLGVVLNPNRYTGNWWMTLPSEISKEETTGNTELRWYGIDNFFLRHPALVSLILGMFRQGVLLFAQNYDEGLLKVVKRKDVERALSDSDPRLAMRILTSLRPWIEVPCNGYRTANYAFPKGAWERLGQLHRSIFKHGFDKLFTSRIEASWGIESSKKTNEYGEPLVHDRYGVITGSEEYWGKPGQRSKTEASKLLAKLGGK